MRRFSFLIFALALLFAFVSGRKDHAERSNAKQSAAINSEGTRPAEGLEAAADAPPSGPAAHSAAPPAAEPESGLIKTAAIIGDPAGKAEPEGNVASALAHVPASAKSGGIDPALEELDEDDLASAAQSELKRLGCYDAKIDGKWGRKSRKALEIFRGRAGSEWTSDPQPELVMAMRNYPPNFCSTETAAQPNPAARVEASAEPDPTARAQAAVEPNSAAGAQPAVEPNSAARVEASAQPTADAPAQAPAQPESGSGQTNTDTSYLPPWMQGAKLTNAEPAAGNTLSDAAPVNDKPKRRTVERRQRKVERFADEYERPRPRSQNWLPKGWPGSRD